LWRARSRYTLFHLEHMTADYQACQQSASVAAMRACLIKHRKGLSNEQMRWFDEHFVTALLGLLPDVRSMFGFGSGRGDFERFFFQSVRQGLLLPCRDVSYT
jgi:hypothetical protein